MSSIMKGIMRETPKHTPNNDQDLEIFARLSKKKGKTTSKLGEGLGFDVRTDVVWTGNMFESTEAGSEFKKWLDDYRSQVSTPKEGQKVILAMANFLGDSISVYYGPAVYVDQDDTHYTLKNATGEHSYSKNTQIVFNGTEDFKKFIMTLKLKFGEYDVKCEKKQVMEGEDPCWKNYKQVGTKKKNGKEVPNCVPKKSVKEVADTRTGVNKTGDIIEPKHDKAYATLKARAPRLYNYIRNEAPVPLDPVMTLQALQSMGSEGAVMSMIKQHIDQDTEKMYDRNHPALAENLKRMFNKILRESSKKKPKLMWSSKTVVWGKNGPEVSNVSFNSPGEAALYAKNENGEAIITWDATNNEYALFINGDREVVPGPHRRPTQAKELAAELLSAISEEKKKGSNGKACWDGYRYAGTENGKDKCVPVKKPKKTKESKVMKGLRK